MEYLLFFILFGSMVCLGLFLLKNYKETIGLYIAATLFAIGFIGVLSTGICGLMEIGYETGRTAVVQEQEHNELMEKQEELINELGLTQEQLELIRSK